jgi:GNAT superfamily N-acetyltransferase
MKIEAVTTPRHGVDLENLAQLHHDEFGCGRAFARQAITNHVIICVRDPDRKWLNGWVAYDDNDKPVGYIIGTIRPSIYNLTDIACQEMWFVLPKYRSGLIAVQLLWHFEKWARDRKVERIYTQVEHDNEPQLVERIIHIMNRLGYKTQGYIAVKHLMEKGNSDDRTTHSEVGVRETAKV